MQSSEAFNLLSFFITWNQKKKGSLAVSKHSGKEQDSRGVHCFQIFALLWGCHFIWYVNDHICIF